MIRRLSQNDIPGFHFCTLNLEKSVQRVLEQLGWVGAHAEEHNLLISVSIILKTKLTGRTGADRSFVQASPDYPRSLPPELVITASDAATSASHSLRESRPRSGSRSSVGKVRLYRHDLHSNRLTARRTG